MRMVVPIAYNFFKFVGIENVSFYSVMGPMQEVPFFGNGFNKWAFPILLGFMMFFTLFKIYGRLMSCLGLSKYGFDGDFSEEEVSNGERQIAIYRRELLEKVNDQQSSGQGSKSTKSGLSNDDAGIEKISAPHDIFAYQGINTKDGVMINTTPTNQYGINDQNSNLLEGDHLNNYSQDRTNSHQDIYDSKKSNLFNY